MGNHSWLVGFVLNIVGNLAINLSANILKYSHTLAPDPVPSARVHHHSHHHRHRRFLYRSLHFRPISRCLIRWLGCISKRSCIWGGSMVLFIVGNLMNFASFAYAAQIMLAALGSIQFLSNVVFAALLLGERPTFGSILGTFLICAGNILVVWFSSHENIAYTVEVMKKVFTGKLYGWYIIASLDLCGVLFVVQLYLQAMFGVDKLIDQLVANSNAAAAAERSSGADAGGPTSLNSSFNESFVSQQGVGVGVGAGGGERPPSSTSGSFVLKTGSAGLGLGVASGSGRKESGMRTRNVNVTTATATAAPSGGLVAPTAAGAAASASTTMASAVSLSTTTPASSSLAPSWAPSSSPSGQDTENLNPTRKDSVGLAMSNVSNTDSVYLRCPNFRAVIPLSRVRHMKPSSSILRLYAVVYVCISGIIGTQAVTYAKALSIIFRMIANGDHRWLDIRTDQFMYVTFLVWMVCMAFWLVRRSYVLRLYDSMFIVPLLQVVWIILSVVQGGVYFGEFAKFTVRQYSAFLLGMMLILLGVAQLTSVGMAGRTSSSSTEALPSSAPRGGGNATTGGIGSSSTPNSSSKPTPVGSRRTSAVTSTTSAAASSSASTTTMTSTPLLTIAIAIPPPEEDLRNSGKPGDADADADAEASPTIEDHTSDEEDEFMGDLRGMVSCGILRSRSLTLSRLGSAGLAGGGGAGGSPAPAGRGSAGGGGTGSTSGSWIAAKSPTSQRMGNFLVGMGTSLPMLPLYNPSPVSLPASDTEYAVEVGGESDRGVVAAEPRTEDNMASVVPLANSSNNASGGSSGSSSSNTTAEGAAVESRSSNNSPSGTVGVTTSTPNSRRSIKSITDYI